MGMSSFKGDYKKKTRVKGRRGQSEKSSVRGRNV